MKLEIEHLSEQLRIQSEERKKDSARHNHQIGELESKLADALDQIEAFDFKLRDAVKQKEIDVKTQYECRINRNGEVISDLRRENEKLKNELDEANSTIEKMKAESADANSGLASSVSELKSKLRSAQAKTREMKQTIAKKDSLIVKIEAEIRELKAKKA